MKKMSFINACRETFQRKPDQSLSEFAAEIKAARDADPQFWVREFAKVGIEIDAASVAAAA